MTRGPIEESESELVLEFPDQHAQPGRCDEKGFGGAREVLGRRDGRATQALIGGSVDVAAASMSDAVRLAIEGRDVRGFSWSTRGRSPRWWSPFPERKNPLDPRSEGTSGGGVCSGSASHQILDFILASTGLPFDAVSTVSVGQSASSVAGLEHGTHDAAMLLGSAIAIFERRHPGSNFLLDLRTPAGAEQVFGSAVFPTRCSSSAR